MFIKTDFDSKKEEVDHLNHNKLDNSIENLKVVSRSENQRNKSAYKGKLFNFVNDILSSYLFIYPPTKVSNIALYIPNGLSNSSL